MIKDKMIPAFSEATGGLFSKVEKADVGDSYQKMEKQGIALMGWADPFMPDRSMPDHIRNALITAMGIEVTSFVQAVEYLVREGLYSDDDIRNIDQVLPKFLDLTAINENDSNDAAGDKLELRKWVAYLAHTLYKVEKKKGQEVTQGVEMWKEINTADNEFAEIRNSWDDAEC